MKKSMTTLASNSKKKKPTNKTYNDSPLSENHSKSVRYRKRVQEELEANEEIRVFDLDEEDERDGY